MACSGSPITAEIKTETGRDNGNADVDNSDEQHDRGSVHKHDDVLQQGDPTKKAHSTPCPPSTVLNLRAHVGRVVHLHCRAGLGLSESCAILGYYPPIGVPATLLGLSETTTHAEPSRQQLTLFKMGFAKGDSVNNTSIASSSHHIHLIEPRLTHPSLHTHPPRKLVTMGYGSQNTASLSTPLAQRTLKERTYLKNALDAGEKAIGIWLT